MRTVWAISICMLRELFRKKDFYVLLMFLVVFLGLLSFQTFFDLEGITRYIKDFGYTLVMFLSFIITLTFVSKQIPAEIESRTIYPLLAKPVSRFMVIFSKYVGGLIVSFSAFSVFYVSFTLFCYANGGWGGDSVLLFAQGFFLGLLFLGLVCALTMLLSTFLTVSANVTLSFLLYLGINGFANTLRDTYLHAKNIAAFFYGFLYYLLPHFEFYDVRVRLTHSWSPIPAWVILSVTVYSLAYCSLLLYLSGIVFRNKKL